jgi:hypothetical protein
LATSGPDKVSWVEICLWRAVLLGALLLLWEVATRRGWVDLFFVSQPTVLAVQIADWIRSGFIFRYLLVTMQETIIGFLLGTLLGVAVGFVFAHWGKSTSSSSAWTRGSPTGSRSRNELGGCWRIEGRHGCAGAPSVGGHDGRPFFTALPEAGEGRCPRGHVHDQGHRRERSPRTSAAT